MELSQELAISLIQSEQQFPVDFDDAWQWAGYSRKSDALKRLKEGLEKGVDFCGNSRKNPQRNGLGRPTGKYYLTVDAFKMFCMMAQTEKGRQVRLYFLECERRLKSVQESSQHRTPDEFLDAYLSMIREHPSFWHVLRKKDHLEATIARTEYAIRELRMHYKPYEPPYEQRQKFDNLKYEFENLKASHELLFNWFTELFKFYMISERDLFEPNR